MNKGFIQLIIIIIILIVVLSLFRIDLKSIVNNDLVKKNLSYVWGLTKAIYDHFLSKPINFIWQNFFKNIITS